MSLESMQASTQKQSEHINSSCDPFWELGGKYKKMDVPFIFTVIGFNDTHVITKAIGLTPKFYFPKGKRHFFMYKKV
jgi:hypothetical protein